MRTNRPRRWRKVQKKRAAWLVWPSALLGSDSPIAHFERLSDGVRRINESPVEVGCVVFGLKNLIPHDEIWPLANSAKAAAGQEPRIGSWQDRTEPLHRLLTLGGGIKRQLETANTAEAVRELFEPSIIVVR